MGLNHNQTTHFCFPSGIFSLALFNETEYATLEHKQMITNNVY